MVIGLVGTAQAQPTVTAAGAVAATSCPHNGGDSVNFSGKFFQRNATNGPLSIHLEDGYNPADGKQYAWTYVQNASKGDVAWVAYTTGSGYIKCGAVALNGTGAFYTNAFLTSASSSVHMEGCATDVSTGRTVCTAPW